MATSETAPGAGAGAGPAGPAAQLTAEWALWGKEETDLSYRIIACSAGDLNAADFAAAVRRYSSGLPDTLPQYLVFWVPGTDGEPEYVGIAVHEHAAFSRRDRRDRFDASGREIVFTRLFCVRYADLAEHGVTFTELAAAAREQPLPPEDEIGPVTLQVGRERLAQPDEPGEPPAAGGRRELAEVVAALLLTTTPVCILGAGSVTPEQRLAFIDQVLSLLPYGLRSTLSASTWASSTARDLKLRLYFPTARPGSQVQAYHVRWDHRGTGGLPVPESLAARAYLDWLRRTGSRSRFLLVGLTAPLRFIPVHIETMVASLPEDLTITDTVEDLAASLGEGDTSAVTAELTRLEQQARHPVSAADRDTLRSQVLRLGLLGNHPELKPGLKERLYHAVIPLAFPLPLTYAAYCEIESVTGGPPRAALRSVLMRLRFASCVPWLLVAKAEPRFSDGELMTILAKQGQPATGPLDEFEHDLAVIHQVHRAAVYDFAVQHLRVHGDDPRAYLTRRGYLTSTLAAAFPDDAEAQRVRLEDTLLFVYGPELSRGQIRELLSAPGLRITPALESAVARLASVAKADRHRAERFVAEQADDARTRQAAAARRDSESDDDPRPGRVGLRRLFSRRVVEAAADHPSEVPGP
jgi:hypothetical protein